MSEIKIASLLLCAGKSSRMSPHHKLLLKLGSESVLKITAERIVKANFSEVIAVTGFYADKIEKELIDLKVKMIHNPSFEKGMHSSIKKGISNLSAHVDFFSVCLADQPLITTNDYNLLIKAVQNNSSYKFIRPIYQGKKGNPAFISAECIKEILEHEDSDMGCVYLFEKYSEHVLHVEMESDSILLDIDTVELWEQTQKRL